MEPYHQLLCTIWGKHYICDVMNPEEEKGLYWTGVEAIKVSSTQNYTQDYIPLTEAAICSHTVIVDRDLI